ncbi:carbohydrate ABC transporter membrane protein 2, CUT1 family (TC 3.A.1.1.-) [Candidatus Thermokryptus mobilis]|uniref:Maltose/maltodextrin transport system permease protein MalG n=1 Tax=Candidatus Thermokryptus mobilis TaxID=1643428 RepID=A0A0S4N9P7_9BACT|nr:sugar ABC transporter permease [Candidatus Thermokryptus mobilis]CUU07547.1 carbohydrate ABC transporter membrane protein 2, CUT1 family (TC 3.A.1.1.-) [Candidatus Thermokryptus mobilis]
MNEKVKKILIDFSAYLFLVIFTSLTIYPVLNVVSISLRPADKLLSTSLSIIPEGATLSSYISLFTETPFLRWLLNSTLISLAVMITGVTLASTAGYALSRFKFFGKKAVMIGILITQMFPATMLLLPLYIMLIKLKLLNSYLGVIIVYTSTALPFCVWQMKGYYDTIPVSLEEAARIDGCNQFQAFYKVVFPLALPALVITALFSFMSSWAEYVVAAQILQEPELYTLAIGLKQFESSMATQWGLYAAGSLFVSIPAVLLFLILSRYLISGLTLGSVKG